jgi:hypothetical protein
MINSAADEADFPDATTSLWIGAFPLLESIYLPGSTESGKVACLLRLFQMALQPEDDV